MWCIAFCVCNIYGVDEREIEMATLMLIFMSVFDNDEEGEAGRERYRLLYSGVVIPGL